MPIGYIYAIKSKMTNDVYIGSTKHKIDRRFQGHKSRYKTNTSLTTAIFILQYEDAYIELIKQINYNDINELRLEEGKVIKNTLNCVNINVPYRTAQEYYLDTKERRQKWNSIQHKCECGGTYNNSNRSGHIKTRLHQNHLDQAFQESFF